MADQVVKLTGAIWDGDSRGSTYQFYAVRLTGSTSVDFEVGPTTANTQRPVGILVGPIDSTVNSSGKPVDVVINGITKAQFGGTVAQGASLSVGADGRLVSLTTTGGSTNNGRYILAQALQNGTSGGVYKVMVHQPYVLDASTA